MNTRAGGRSDDGADDADDFYVPVPFYAGFGFIAGLVADAPSRREHDPRVREGIQLSINAVATALRNSG